ncbi:hypothetical protein ACQ4PT_044999 [Festuca glaucescens]
MKGADAEPETGSSPTIDVSPPATQTARRRPTQVIERNLYELDTCLTALTSRPRRSDVDGSLFTEIRAKTDFLRVLIAAERDSHRGTLPEHLVDVEWRFGVIERTIEEWAQSAAVGPTEEEEEPDEAAAGSGSASGSGGCSCTDSCSGFEVMGKEAAFDAKCNLDQDDAEAHKDKQAAAAAVPAAVAAAAAAIEVPPATRTTARRRWWTRRAALCGAAAVVAVAALGAGLALEFAAVAQQSVYVVPT